MRKQIYVFGDELICEALRERSYGSRTAEQSLPGFLKRLEREQPVSISSYARDGAAFSGKTSIIEQLNAAFEGTPDAVIFNGGANDMLRPHAEAKSILNEIENAFRKLAKAFMHGWPGARIMFMTLHRSYGIDKGLQKAVHELETRLCRELGIYLIDIFGLARLDTSKEAYKEDYILDGSFFVPNTWAGAEFYTPIVTRALCEAGIISDSNPFYDWPKHCWAVYCKGNREEGDILYTVSEYLRDGLIYRYFWENQPKDRRFSHSHGFEGVLVALTDSPEGFSVEGFEEDYSKQELALLERLKEKLLERRQRNK